MGEKKEEEEYNAETQSAQRKLREEGRRNGAKNVELDSGSVSGYNIRNVLSDLKTIAFVVSLEFMV